MAADFSVASVVEDMLRQHGSRLGELDLDLRRAEEVASRRNEAAGWLRKMVGVVTAKDLPAEPSEEEFRLGLRSGIILCNALNKVQPGAVPKVVEKPCDAAIIPDGAALSAYQYFENVRNFLVAGQDLGLPTFEASDLGQGGNSARVVNCVLALKSYSDWKQSGGNGVFKFGGNVKSANLGKYFVRKNSEPFMKSLPRTSSMNGKSLDAYDADFNSDKMSSSGPLSTLISAILLDKKPEEVSLLVESMLSKVAEEFEHRFESQYEMKKTASKETNASHGNKFRAKPLGDRETEAKGLEVTKKEELHRENKILDRGLKNQLLGRQTILDQQQKNIEELRLSIHSTKSSMHFMQKKFHEEFNNLGMHICGLAQAASNYHGVLEENRQLYNQVQDLKGSIRVYCRVRPFLNSQPNYLSTVENIDEGNITINTMSKHGRGCKSFSFNKVFGPSATQAEVFSDMQPLIRSVLDGYNVCIFAYGQTGSGKTYTMTGPKELIEKSQGVNFRALNDLFLIAEQRKDAFRYEVAVQMIEIYNEQVRDLLVTDRSNKRLEIRNNSSHTGLSVPDASLVPVSSTYNVIDLMKLGQKNRVVGATALNDRSSRSHCCLTVHVQGKDLTSGAMLRGCMHLVDLAGSERVSKSEATGDRLKEAQHINKSLSALGDVISSLAQKNPHVPYRNSKLTQLLQDSLGGQAKTLMFVHISPEQDALGETISTLKFAERVATVELGAARVNKDGADVKELKEQIAGLKAALARKEIETEQSKNSASKRCRTQTSESSAFSFQQSIGDVGNIEAHSTPNLTHKTQCFDLDESVANLPPWPPAISPSQNCRDDDKDSGSGEWVDKVMVNKQESVNLHNDFCQKYLQDSSRIFSEQSYNMLVGNNNSGLDFTTSADERDDLDAATTDSSEPDSRWQLNRSKLTGLINGIGSKTKQLGSKSTKSTQIRNSNNPADPSPSRKQLNNGGIRGGRHPAAAETKHRAAVNRK